MASNEGVAVSKSRVSTSRHVECSTYRATLRRYGQFFPSLQTKAAAGAALNEWGARHEALEGRRRPLVAAAWRAGERNISALATLARVTRDTIYADLRATGIDPKVRDDREGAVYAAVRDVAQLLAPGSKLNPQTVARLAGPIGAAAATLAAGGSLPHVLDAARDLLDAAETAAPPDRLAIDLAMVALRTAVDAYPLG